MALLRRLVRSDHLLRLANRECGIGFVSRYASSDSKKPGDSTAAAPSADEVSYQKRKGGSKKEEKGSGSQKDDKVAAGTKKDVAPKEQEAANNEAPTEAKAKVEDTTAKKNLAKNVAPKQDEGGKKEEKAAPAQASVEVSYTKKSAKGSKTKEVATNSDVKQTTASAAKASPVATTAAPTASQVPAAPSTSKASDKAEAKSSDGNAVPSAESLLNEPLPQSTPSESEGDVEVGYKRRTMPLPEDIVVEEEVEAQTAEGQRTAPSKKAFVPPQQVYDYTLPLPRIIVLPPKKKKTPVSLGEAITLVKESAHCRFIETVEAHIQLGVDPKRSDQIVRGAVTLPHGSGRVVKVAVFADGAAAEEALAAGADVVGTDELVEKIFASGGKLDFDKCIAIPSVMSKLGKVARILGPRGMMPNPKTGTVTLKVAEAVKAAKQGRVDFRADKTSIVHAGLGKVNFPDEHLHENIAAFAAAVLGAKPAGFKKSSRYSGFFDKFYLSCTMGPGVPVTIQSVAAASDSYIKSQELE